jgi:hypothetical protein
MNSIPSSIMMRMRYRIRYKDGLFKSSLLDGAPATLVTVSDVSDRLTEILLLGAD